MTDPKKTETDETVKDQPATTEAEPKEGQVSDAELDGVAGAGITVNLFGSGNGGISVMTNI